MRQTRCTKVVSKLFYTQRAAHAVTHPYDEYSFIQCMEMKVC
jgi:hypothetical protein